MGQEAKCQASFGGQVSEGRAYLEATALLFRGEFRLQIPFNQITALTAANGELAVTSAAGIARFQLGPLADKWRERILHPKSLLDKLGIKADSKVAALNLADEDFLRQLRERVGEFSTVKPPKVCDVILLGVSDKAALRRLAQLQKHLGASGALWVIFRKGQSHCNENDVRAAGKQAGLVDVKVVSFSATHSGLKLVIPKARR